MGRVRMLGGRLSTVDLRRVKPVEKQRESLYSTPEFLAWRELIVERAGRRCEAVDHGQRCRKAEPYNRMFADHIIEVRDGGALFDPANGQCLCGSHHTLKTNAARAAREADRRPSP